MAKPSGEQIFVDFKPYGPLNGEPAAFLSTAVANGSGDTIGVLAYQMPIENISAITNTLAGLGQTGKTLLPDPDNLMLANSQLSDSAEILVGKLKNNITEAVFSGTPNSGNGTSRFDNKAYSRNTFGRIRGAMGCCGYPRS